MLEPGEQRKGRRELADSLRDLRRAAGLSGERLAARCAMSQSKVSRIESGKVLPTVVDVERILAALDVGPLVTRDLLDLARAANVDYASWRSVARVGVWRKQMELKALAESSVVVRQFLPAVPSGLIQSPAYARQVLTPTIEGRPARDVERALRARLESQQVLDDPDRRFVFLLTEQAVRWRRADDGALVEQLEHMTRVAGRANVNLAVVPIDVTVSVTPLNTFTVYDERLVLAEVFSGEIALRDPRDVAYHLNVFEFFLQRALRAEQVAELLARIKDEIMRERG
jgi:transcriptional regulator with XRE-family HTH domain